MPYSTPNYAHSSSPQYTPTALPTGGYGPSWLASGLQGNMDAMKKVMSGTWATDPSNPFSGWPSGYDPLHPNFTPTSPSPRGKYQWNPNFNKWLAPGDVGYSGDGPPTTIEPSPSSTPSTASGGSFWTTPPAGAPPGSVFTPDNPANPSMGGVWKDPSGNPIGGARGPGGDLLVNPPVTTSTPPTSPGTQSAFTPMQQTQQPFDLSSLLNFIPQFMQNQYQSPFQPTQQQGGTGYNLGTIPGWGWGGSP